MSLPVKFKNVHYYRIAGKYIFAGDMFIARDGLYFFPETDMAEQREAIARYMPEALGLFITAMIYLGQRFGGTYISRTEFWREGLSHQMFQNEAAAHIERLKFQRQYEAFAETLPLPTHVRTREVFAMKLSRTGKLSFEAQSDNHDFNVGVLRRDRVRNSLWEAGMGLL